VRLGPIVIFAGGLLLGVAAFGLVNGLPTPEAAVAALTTTTQVAPPIVAPAPTAPPVPPAPTAPPTAPSAPRTAPSAPTAPARSRLVIHGVGDVNTDTSYIPALAVEGHAHAWSGLDGLFREDGLTVINLECTPSDLGEPHDKDYVFRCDPDSLAAMREAGVDVASLANNHSGDHGERALVDGLTRLEAAGVTPVGVGRDVMEAASPAVFEVGGWKVAVLGFGGVIPAFDWLAAEGRAGMADGDTIDTMAEAVRAADAVADLVVVTIHWGVERDLQPRPMDRERAEAMIEAGADVIFGHHPHRLQPLELVKGVPVAWSLGNFVWPDLSPESSTTAIARVVVAPDGELDACLIPAFIGSPGRPVMTADPPC
jgi:hypothetical protein